jgi:hypothetical protein
MFGHLDDCVKPAMKAFLTYSFHYIIVYDRDLYPRLQRLLHSRPVFAPLS